MSSRSHEILIRPHGNITQLFNFECASLVLLNFDENKTLRLLRLGEFVVNLIVQTTNNIAISTCQVQDLEWLVAKDAPVIRLGHRSFAFGMPVLLFGVQFPPFCNQGTLDSLEKLFLKVSDYRDLLWETRGGYPCPDNDLNFWRNIRPHVEEICRSRLARFGHSFIQRSPLPGPGGDSASSNLLRAVRMCATTKIMADAVLTGFLKSVHISVLDNGHLRGRARSIHDIGSEHAYASIEVVSNIVQAMEMIWTATPKVINSSQEAVATTSQGESVTNRPWLLPIKHWKLNVAGLSIFLHNPTVQNAPRPMANREAMTAEYSSRNLQN